jgi:hypothetical protein
LATCIVDLNAGFRAPELQKVCKVNTCLSRLGKLRCLLLGIEVQNISDQDDSGIGIAPVRFVLARYVFGECLFSPCIVILAATSADFAFSAVEDDIDCWSPFPCAAEIKTRSFGSWRHFSRILSI